MRDPETEIQGEDGGGASRWGIALLACCYLCAIIVHFCERTSDYVRSWWIVAKEWLDQPHYKDHDEEPMI